MEVYGEICRVNPSLKLPKIEEYKDYQEVFKEEKEMRLTKWVFARLIKWHIQGSWVFF